MNKIRMIIFAILAIAVAVMGLVLSGMRDMLNDKTREIEEARSQIDALNANIETTNAEMVRMKGEIEAASRRIDAAITTMTKGERDARERHEMRMDEVTKMDARDDVHDWLCEPVPDDVCMLFEGYAGPVSSD